MTATTRPYRTVRFENETRVVLTFWGMAKEDRLQNILCVDRHGAVRWRAALPSAAAARDCFVSLKRNGERLIAKTWSGLVVELCPATGAHLAAA